MISSKNFFLSVGFPFFGVAANMADAYARVKGELGVCVGTVGPGGANLVPGVYPAWADGVPLVVLTAQNQTWRSYLDHGSMQALDHYNLFKPITKWNAVVSQWERIPKLVQHAFRVATSGRQARAFRSALRRSVQWEGVRKR